MSKLENLFICVTPLQIVIAKRIIEEKQLQHVGFIILFYNENTKYRFYIDSLKTENYLTIEYLVSSQKKFDRLIEVFKLKLFLNQVNLSTQNIYLASIDNSLIYTILSKINFRNLLTFDDGLANLNYQGQYYIDQESSLQKLFKKVIHVSWNIEKIKKISKCHYTIYPNQNNIISNIIPISLLNLENINLGLTHPKKIFLGQPLSEIDLRFTSKYINKILNKIGISYYYPHPRENTPVSFKNINIIQSNKIIEDYLLELSKDSTIELYTFFSTAVINLVNTPNIKCYVLYNEQLLSKFNNLYDIFKHSNITLIQVNDFNE